MNHQTPPIGVLGALLLGILLLSGCATDDLKGCEPTQQAGTYYCLTKKPDPSPSR